MSKLIAEGKLYELAACPKCKAASGTPCVSANTKELSDVHAARRKLSLEMRKKHPSPLEHPGGGAPVTSEVATILVEGLSNLWWARTALGLLKIEHDEDRKSFTIITKIDTFVVTVKRKKKV